MTTSSLTLTHTPGLSHLSFPACTLTSESYLTPGTSRYLQLLIVLKGAISPFLQVAAENGLLAAQQQFEAGLSELRSKADLLSSTLDKEAGGRKVAQEEVCVCVCLSACVCVSMHVLQVCVCVHAMSVYVYMYMFVRP